MYMITQWQLGFGLYSSFIQDLCLLRTYVASVTTHYEQNIYFHEFTYLYTLANVFLHNAGPIPPIQAKKAMITHGKRNA